MPSHLSRNQIATFQDAVYAFYDLHGRHELPWRQPNSDGSFDPYAIMVSEQMLQQTQVPRVIPKFQSFLRSYPTVQQLAAADLGDVLRAWQGLGYNRRAKFLYQAAQRVVENFDAIFPTTQEALVSLPGIGKNTAGAILAYAYNQPAVFIETNVRTVFIHHFFAAAETATVSDVDILQLVTDTLDHDQPRQWYWALMDYGSSLKRSSRSSLPKSKHYVKQSTFAGSKRQIRGAVIRALSSQPQSIEELGVVISDERLAGVLQELLTEGLIRNHGNQYHL